MVNKLAASFAMCLFLSSICLDKVSANDSTSHSIPSGIEFIKNHDISMDSEMLFLGDRFVEVEYEFYNHSDKAIKLPMAFPLPEIDIFMQHIPGAKPEAYDFRVYVDNQEIKDVKLQWRALVRSSP